jgi:dienelactone hydrolase
MTSYDNVDYTAKNILKTELKINVDKVILMGELALPPNAKGIVLFVHGSGSGRHSARNLYVASVLQSAGIGTLLFDLLTEVEEVIDSHTAHLRFNIGLLSERLVHVTRWVQNNPGTEGLKIGYFGASTGAAAALVAAALLGKQIFTVISRGGRPDLADGALSEVKCPTLLIVGSFDNAVIELNKQAAELMTCEKTIKIVYAASHLFEEPGKLEDVAKIASEWFVQKLKESS